VDSRTPHELFESHFDHINVSRRLFFTDCGQTTSEEDRVMAACRELRPYHASG